MSIVDNWLCILDIKNQQEDYARAFQLVSGLTGIEQKEAIQNKGFPIPFRITWNPKSDQGSAINPSILENSLHIAPPSKVRNITSWDQLINGLEKNRNQNRFSYYIRLDLNSSTTDLTSLRYLVLLLQAHPELQTRSTIFIWNSEKVSAFAENEQYFRISNFLQFIQSKYHCFFSTYNGNPQPLTIQASGVQQTFLPLLEIDQDTYRALKYPRLMQIQFQNQRFADLYKALVPLDGESSKSSMTLFQIGLRALFHNLNGHRYNNEKKKRALLELLVSTINESMGITPLDALLFGVLMDDHIRDGFNENQLRDYLSNIQLFASAILQLLENIVFHSMYAKGVFTWRLHKDQDYIHTNYPGYMITKQDYGLELFIADSNCQDGILDHFLASGKAPLKLLQHSNKLILSDFFQDTPDGPAGQLWMEARNAHPEICHGLRSFSHAVNLFGGTFYVRSSPSTLGKDQRTYYYKSNQDDSRLIFDANQYWMPGTQFSAMFMRTAFQGKKTVIRENATIFDRAHIIYTTTYHDLAQILQFKRKIEPLFVHETAKSISKCIMAQNDQFIGQEKKDAVAISWKNWFNQRILCYEKEMHKTECDYVLLAADLSDFQKSREDFPGEMESFCKGFLSSNIFQSRKEERFYIILLNNISISLSRSFYQALYVMHKYIDASRANVYFYQAPEENQDTEQMERNATPYLSASLQELLHQISPDHPKDQKEFPKTLPYLLLIEKEPNTTLFESFMKQQALISILDRNAQGYKIEDTHMRLGNKVHLDVFFEMALFFENPNYAYYTAFLILQRLKSREKFLQAKKILFYGYASYSRGVVWAIIQIWREYLKLLNSNNKEDYRHIPEIEFVIYQNDLKLESDQSNIQMYFSREEWQRDAKSIWEPSETLLVQIVPISSSLTTFNKMLTEFGLATGKSFCPFANFTAFWVRDDYLKKQGTEKCPTKEEKDFWKEVDSSNKRIKSPALITDVEYLIHATSYWRNPLTCEKCFPDDPLLEIPLVETDPTSTIPTQQLYLVPESKENRGANPITQSENDIRVAGLRGNILYGHISRGHNHFQYYIQTRQYFLQERYGIETWLDKLADGDRTENTEVQPINILIIPQQTSNVEFSQIVYEHYFKGEAESIIVNTEKEFRSNFLAEYSGLANRLIQDKKDGRVLHFHYVDMSIDSGITFHRASALIQSLFCRQNEPLNQEPNFQFDNIFLLISRMSSASKRNYVRHPEKQFHAYVELNISNMRTFGDSCIPCKLRNEAERYFKYAATKASSAFWEKKYIEYHSTPFDSSELRSQEKESVFKRAYFKLACTHRASHYINAVRGGNVSNYFQAVKSYLIELQDAYHKCGSVSSVYQGLNDQKKLALDWFSSAIKIIARPFYSFDYRLRCAVLDVYLLLTEYFLNSDVDLISNEHFKSKKAYIAEADLIWAKSFVEDIESALVLAEEPHKSVDQRRLWFIQHILLKGLADLKSNYIMRRETIIRVFNKVSRANLDMDDRRKLFESYRRSILRLVHNSSDEIKSLWLEHLLQFYHEYPQEISPKATAWLEGFSDIPENVKDEFHKFMELLLVENNRPLLQGVKNLQHITNTVDNNQINELNDYHMRNVCQFINLCCEGSYSTDDRAARKRLIPLVNLYKLLMAPQESKKSEIVGSVERSDPLKRYNALQEALQTIIQGDEQSDDILKRVILFGFQQPEKRVPSGASYYMISPQPPIDFNGQLRFDRALIELEARLQNHTTDLNTQGFSLLEGDSNDHYDVALLLDNNYKELEDIPDRRKYRGQRIEPMYIFLPCNTTKKHALMLVRDILMFRCNLVAWLEQDFNNNAIPTLAQQRHWAETLAADKVGDHGEQDFVEGMRRVLCTEIGEHNSTEQEQFESNPALKDVCPVKFQKKDGTIDVRTIVIDDNILNELRHWYLLCSYVNSRIARLYRTYAQEASHEEYSHTSEYLLQQIKINYSRKYLQIGLEVANSLADVFFSWIEGESSRRDYLVQILELVTFEFNGKKDTCNGDSIYARQSFVKEELKAFYCVQFSKDDIDYGYLSEYLAIIILDCCISALKVSRTWRINNSGYEAFLALHNCSMEEKCQIKLYREKGGEEFDYLVIENEVFPPVRSENKSGPGMSQTAIRWYIDKLWKFRKGNTFNKPEDNDNAGMPKVQLSQDPKGSQYQIKLPILKVKE